MSSRALAQHKPKTPSKLRTVVTAKSSKRKSSNRSASRSPLQPPKPSVRKAEEKSTSKPNRLIFSKLDNPDGFLELRQSVKGPDKNVVIQISKILDTSGKTQTFKVVLGKLHDKYGLVTTGEDVESVRKNNIKMLKEMDILNHHQYTYGGQKTRSQRKGKTPYNAKPTRKHKPKPKPKSKPKSSSFSSSPLKKN